MHVFAMEQVMIISLQCDIFHYQCHLGTFPLSELDTLIKQKQLVSLQSCNFFKLVNYQRTSPQKHKLRPRYGEILSLV